jgi:hypothetical protein
MELTVGHTLNEPRCMVCIFDRFGKEMCRIDACNARELGTALIEEHVRILYSEHQAHATESIFAEKDREIERLRSIIKDNEEIMDLFEKGQRRNNGPI